MIKKSTFLFIFLFIVNILSFASYPLIKNLGAKDSLFIQQQKEVESWYKSSLTQSPPPPLNLYQYQPKEDEGLLQLASWFNLNIETLATLNNIEFLKNYTPRTALLIPTIPGLYIAENKLSYWEDLLKKKLKNPQPLTLLIQGQKKKILFFQGEPFPPSLRKKFILGLFTPPLSHRYITASFGYRTHPITKKWALHRGVDYRAKIGTSVKPIAQGEIIQIGELTDYGKYIIVKHKGEYTSLYAHLSEILVTKGDAVTPLTIIGKTGNSGLSTGPHLHLEIRRKGKPLNPEDFLM